MILSTPGYFGCANQIISFICKGLQIKLTRICHLTFFFHSRHSSCVTLLITASHIHNLPNNGAPPSDFLLQLNLPMYFKHLFNEKGESIFFSSFGVQNNNSVIEQDKWNFQKLSDSYKHKMRNDGKISWFFFH